MHFQDFTEMFRIQQIFRFELECSYKSELQGCTL